MEKALAIFETKGFAPAVAAAEIILKEISVEIRDIRLLGDGNVTVFFSGNVKELKAAIDIGIKHARVVGKIVGTYILPQPHPKLEELLFKNISNHVAKDLRPAMKEMQFIEPDNKLKKKLTSASPIKSIDQKKPSVNSITSSKGKSTIQRLRDEALSSRESSKAKYDHLALDENTREIQINLNRIDSLNVHALRKLARDTYGFPIQGREISRALRKELIEYFKELV